jgi:hypothetical protein
MKKEKHLRVRITETQFKQLIDNIILEEKKSKSEFVRQAINEKLERSKINGTKKIT